MRNMNSGSIGSMRFPLVLSVFLAFVGVSSGYLEAGAIDFATRIRPLLSENCFQCHGPDEAQRKADLRLDLFEGATQDLGGYAALVPGKPEASEMLRRISSSDPDEVMPPPDKAERLSPDQVGLLRQ